MNSGLEVAYLLTPSYLICLVIPTLSGAKDLLLSTLHILAECEKTDGMAGRSGMCENEEKLVPRLPFPLRSALGQGPLGMTIQSVVTTRKDSGTY